MVIMDFIFLVLVSSIGVTGYDMLSAKGDTVENKAVVLVCKSDKINSLVSFTNNNGSSIAACFDSNTCMSRFGYNITQNTTRQETYLTIPLCNESVEGTWHCFYKIDTQYNLSCIDPPETVVIKEQAGNKYKCISECSDVVSSFRFELLEVDSMAILHTSTIKAAVESSSKCTKESQRAYSASFKALKYDHVPDKTVKIRCYAIAKSITESENIPFATTKTTITPTGVPSWWNIYITTIVILLTIGWLISQKQLACVHHLNRSNSEETKAKQSRYLSTSEYLFAQIFAYAYMMLVMELLINRPSKSLNSIPTITTICTALLLVVLCSVFLIRQTVILKNMGHYIVPIILPKVAVIASVIEHLAAMILVRYKCDRRLMSANSVDDDSLPTTMTESITPCIVVVCIAFLIHLKDGRYSKFLIYDRVQISMAKMVILATLVVNLVVMFSVRLKCNGTSNSSNDFIPSMIILLVAMMMAGIFFFRLVRIQLSIRSNNPDNRTNSSIEV